MSRMNVKYTGFTAKMPWEKQRKGNIKMSKQRNPNLSKYWTFCSLLEKEAHLNTTYGHPVLGNTGDFFPVEKGLIMILTAPLYLIFFLLALVIWALTALVDVPFYFIDRGITALIRRKK